MSVQIPIETGPTGIDLVRRHSRDGFHYNRGHVCPGCESDLNRTAIIHLAYTFRACNCGEPNYEHLVEQLWHLACLQGRQTDVDFAATAALDLLEDRRWRGLNRDSVLSGLKQALARRSA